MSAYIAYDQDHGRDRLVRQLVREFRGLTGTAKQKAVLDATGLARTNLSELANGDGHLGRYAPRRLPWGSSLLVTKVG